MSSTERVAICRTKLVFLKTVARCCITTVTRVTLCWCTSWIDEKRKKKAYMYDFFLSFMFDNQKCVHVAAIGFT